MYFLVTAKYDKMMDNGLVKKVKDQYLFDALSFVEAETRAIEELSPFISGDFTVDAIKKARISEIFTSDADRFYRVNVGFIVIDEKTGIEKRNTNAILVQASDFDDAVNSFMKGMSGTMADFEIIGVTETPILEYFPAKLI